MDIDYLSFFCIIFSFFLTMLCNFQCTYKSFSSLIKFILQYFLPFDAIANQLSLKHSSVLEAWALCTVKKSHISLKQIATPYLQFYICRFNRSQIVYYSYTCLVKNNQHMSGPVQFKLMLLKDQLYSYQFPFQIVHCWWVAERRAVFCKRDT